jgi:hypothetical protein
MAYTGTALGFSVLHVDADLLMDSADYRIDVNFRTVGLLALFVSADFHSTTWGVWRNGQAEPTRFWSSGQLRGNPREVLIDYRDGRPVVSRLTPPNKSDDRDPVSPAERDATIDTLSALALLVHEVATTGTCEGEERVFDGRRLTEIDVHTAGEVEMPRGAAGTYAGETLRCDFTGRELAGFKRDGSDWQHEPHNGEAWLGQAVPDDPPIPVRLDFGTRWLSNVTMVLDAAGPGPLPSPPR